MRGTRAAVPQRHCPAAPSIYRPGAGTAGTVRLAQRPDPRGGGRGGAVAGAYHKLAVDEAGDDRAPRGGQVTERGPTVGRGVVGEDAPLRLSRARLAADHHDAALVGE